MEKKTSWGQSVTTLTSTHEIIITVEMVCEYLQLLHPHEFLDVVAEAIQWFPTAPDMADGLIQRLTSLYGKEEGNNI